MTPKCRHLSVWTKHLWIGISQDIQQWRFRMTWKLRKQRFNETQQGNGRIHGRAYDFGKGYDWNLNLCTMHPSVLKHWVLSDWIILDCWPPTNLQNWPLQKIQPLKVAKKFQLRFYRPPVFVSVRCTHQKDRHIYIYTHVCMYIYIYTCIYLNTSYCHKIKYIAYV